MDPTECAFDTPEQLLTEMICQRLAQVSTVHLQNSMLFCTYVRISVISAVLSSFAMAYFVIF